VSTNNFNGPVGQVIQDHGTGHYYAASQTVHTFEGHQVKFTCAQLPTLRTSLKDLKSALSSPSSMLGNALGVAIGILRGKPSLPATAADIAKAGLVQAELEAVIAALESGCRDNPRH
jgi:hypothetical protein